LFLLDDRDSNRAHLSALNLVEAVEAVELEDGAAG
jgi:hypothetical protein